MRVFAYDLNSGPVSKSYAVWSAYLLHSFLLFCTAEYTDYLANAHAMAALCPVSNFLSSATKGMQLNLPFQGGSALQFLFVLVPWALMVSFFLLIWKSATLMIQHAHFKVTYLAFVSGRKINSLSKINHSLVLFEYLRSLQRCMWNFTFVLLCPILDITIAFYNKLLHQWCFLPSEANFLWWQETRLIYLWCLCRVLGLCQPKAVCAWNKLSVSTDGRNTLDFTLSLTVTGRALAVACSCFKINRCLDRRITEDHTSCPHLLLTVGSSNSPGCPFLALFPRAARLLQPIPVLNMGHLCLFSQRGGDAQSSCSFSIKPWAGFAETMTVLQPEVLQQWQQV